MTLVARFGHLPAHDRPMVMRKQLFFSSHQRDDHLRRGLKVSDFGVTEGPAQGFRSLGLWKKR